MNNKTVISDTGVIISLSIIDKLFLFDKLFGFVFIPKAVWIELEKYQNLLKMNNALDYFKNKVKSIQKANNLSLFMDKGESEAIILCEELDADLLILDDRKARTIAETLKIKCIGTLGILIYAKEKGLIKDLKTLFQTFLETNRFFSKKLLNQILAKNGESML